MVVSTGLVSPHDPPPFALVADSVPGRAITVLAGAAPTSDANGHDGASILLATHGDRAFGTELAPVLAALGPLVEGRIAPEDWTTALAEPTRRSRKAHAA
jgi:hypothetical protein